MLASLGPKNHFGSTIIYHICTPLPWPSLATYTVYTFVVAFPLLGRHAGCECALRPEI